MGIGCNRYESSPIYYQCAQSLSLPQNTNINIGANDNNKHRQNEPFNNTRTYLLRLLPRLAVRIGIAYGFAFCQLLLELIGHGERILHYNIRCMQEGGQRLLFCVMRRTTSRTDIHRDNHRRKMPEGLCLRRTTA